MLQLSQAEVHECEPGRMEQILNRGEGEEGCKPRLTVIRLPEPQDQFSHVTPSHIEVNTWNTGDTVAYILLFYFLFSTLIIKNLFMQIVFAEKKSRLTLQGN